MTYAFVAITHATLGGVYYTPSFTTSGAQPVWTRLTTTGLPSTDPDIFRVDYGDPLNVQYLGFNCTTNTDTGEIYARTGGNWSKIMDTTIASTVTGATIVYLQWLWTDPYNDLAVYSQAMTAESGLATNNYILKSIDYGENWSVYGNSVNITRSGYEINVIGNNIWMGARGVTSTRLAASLDGGTTWGVQTIESGAATPTLSIDPTDPDRCYTHLASTGMDSCAITAPATITKSDTAYGGDADLRSDGRWVDPDNPGYVVALNNGDLDYTENSFTSSTNVNLDTAETDLAAITNFWNTTESDLVFGTKSGAVGARIYHISSKTDTSTENRSGANSTVPPYTDSIPEVGYVVMYGIWAGTPPATAGVYVYADEQGDITDIPDPDNLGIPMFGDRSSWRDYDADDDGAGTTLADYHAQDIQEDTPQRHAPWSVPAPAADYGIVSDGAKWVISAAEMALVTDLHDPVTLDADAAAILDLNVQEIGLDVQNSNTVLAGPAAGAANEPTFRALVLADLPLLPITTDDLHQHTYQEDHTAECDGAEDNFITANQFEENTTMVWLNGILQRPDVDYTEDVTLDALTFTTAPEDDDILIIAYIVDLEV